MSERGAARRLRGACHCGALRVEFATALEPAQLQVRACQCSFCRTHGALSISDPLGLLTFQATDPQALVRYRFGLKLSDFLICARCGTYMGVFMEDPGGDLGVLNLNVLEARDQFGAPSPMNYEGETPATRVQRRRERWTPARLEVA
ncbi:MAG TPA: hypothetical protein VKB41_14810 [Steroidobacteraceae bacterium]|jgi:hypothetical protein|nr:hypothetical protein [Steroidobacteraceae bacterium]